MTTQNLTIPTFPFLQSFFYTREGELGAETLGLVPDQAPFVISPTNPITDLQTLTLSLDLNGTSRLLGHQHTINPPVYVLLRTRLQTAQKALEFVAVTDDFMTYKDEQFTHYFLYALLTDGTQTMTMTWKQNITTKYYSVSLIGTTIPVLSFIHPRPKHEQQAEGKKEVSKVDEKQETKSETKSEQTERS